jgi:phospholipid/cholesterol/gamma-HCH transport system substrate-binding protein
MPGSSKTKWAQLKIGLLAIAALIIVGVLIFLMGFQGAFESKSFLYTFLSDSAGIAEGAPVALSGVDINGKITKVDFSGSTDPARIVRVTMQIPTKYLSSIPVDSQTDMASANLLGTKYINIKRGKSPQSVQPGAELATLATSEISDLFRQSSQTLGTLEEVVDKLNAIVADIQAGKGSIGQLLVDDTLVKNFVDIEVQFKQLASDLHHTITSSDNSLGKLLTDNGVFFDDVHNGVLSLDKSIQGINKVVDGVNNGEGTLGQLARNPAMYDDLRQILGDTHALLAGIQAGKGTAGKLVAGDEFGDEIKNTMGKVDALLDKMNNGTGSFARLMNDPALFEDLDSLTRESQGLMKDFRSNPKKFLHIKLSLF